MDRITITRREDVRAADLGLVLAATLHRMHPRELNLDACLKLLGDKPTLEALKAGKSTADIRRMWQPALQEFGKRRGSFLLYPRR